MGQGVLFHRILPEIVFRRDFDPPQFSLNLALKDVALATSLGHEYDVPMAMADLTLRELTAAVERGWGNRDSRVAMLLQEERAGGIELRIPESQLGEDAG